MPPSERSTGTSRSLERGLAILSSFNSDRPLIGVSELSRDLDLSRSTAHRYIATLAQLGYLQQDRDSKRYRLGPEGARPRLLGHQLDGRARDLRAAPAAAERRDRVHRQPRDPRGHRRRVHRALPLGRGRASARSTSTSTSAHGFRPTARPWARRSSRSCPRMPRGDHRAHRLRPARTEHVHQSRRRSARSSRGSAPPVSRSTTRSSRTASARSPRRSARTRARSSRRSTSPCIAPWSSKEELIARFGPAVTRTARDISLGMGHRQAPR